MCWGLGGCGCRRVLEERAARVALEFDHALRDGHEPCIGARVWREVTYERACTVDDGAEPESFVAEVEGVGCFGIAAAHHHVRADDFIRAQGHACDHVCAFAAADGLVEEHLLADMHGTESFAGNEERGEASGNFIDCFEDLAAEHHVHAVLSSGGEDEKLFELNDLAVRIPCEGAW